MNMTRLARIAGVEEEPISSDAQDCGHDRVRLTWPFSGRRRSARILRKQNS
jgi:hypothetical protein